MKRSDTAFEIALGDMRCIQLLEKCGDVLVLRDGGVLAINIGMMVLIAERLPGGALGAELAGVPGSHGVDV